MTIKQVYHMRNRFVGVDAMPIRMALTEVHQRSVAEAVAWQSARAVGVLV